MYVNKTAFRLPLAKRTVESVLSLSKYPPFSVNLDKFNQHTAYKGTTNYAGVNDHVMLKCF